MTDTGARVLGPGRYGLARLRPGDRIVTGTRTVSIADIDAFAALSGDRFAIHMDADAARRYGFADRVAHGLLVLSLVDGLKNAAPAQFDAIASLGWDWQFRAPVLAGDTIGAAITVRALTPSSSKPDRGVATLDFEVTNQRGEIVQTGVNRLMICR
ncbi:MaoC family dehydratase [Sinisalibacter aestuarii]|uniref:Acyl dehydratase n=1 Tax=Sinisalibacter aestuarii TaxID=2949426 RepID=A0ABQ5LZV2_9RHOB|nr:MaoC/PaaZ C-terminal domain-containing protein [Sinisalibacter aestuarii]GKY90006.1 acyl dehydratase [Sinisalibacter aestuarii]